MPKISPEKIKEWKNKIEEEPHFQEDKEKVLDKYGRIFDPDNLGGLTKEKFKSFLLYKNNKHWKSIHRQGNMITEDMKKLREALRILLDENKDTKERLETLIPKNKSNFIKGLGRAVLTPILLTVYPEKYGVYNSKSEQGLKNLGLYPDFKRGAPFADRYYKVNEVLKELSGRYDVSLWDLDRMLGWASSEQVTSEEEEKEEKLVEVAEEKGINDIFDFTMEKHLEDFLISNWKKTPLGKDYNLIIEDGDIKSQQYSTDVGPIDILVREKEGKDWVVIELKKGRSSDKVIGQISRYMGWVEDNLAKDEEKVRGLIIAERKNEKLKYGLRVHENIDYLEYEIKFDLKEKSKE